MYLDHSAGTSRNSFCVRKEGSTELHNQSTGVHSTRKYPCNRSVSSQMPIFMTPKAEFALLLVPLLQG